VKSFSKWLGVDKDTGRIFADGSGLPFDAVRRWTIQEQRDFPRAGAEIPDDQVLVAPLDQRADYCYSVSRKEATSARLLPEQ
jgi:hypothetical protein